MFNSGALFRAIRGDHSSIVSNFVRTDDNFEMQFLEKFYELVEHVQDTVPIELGRSCLVSAFRTCFCFKTLRFTCCFCCCGG